MARFETLVTVEGTPMIAYWDQDDAGNPIVRRVVSRRSNKDFVSPKIYDAVRASLVARMSEQLEHNKRAAKWRSF